MTGIVWKYCNSIKSFVFDDILIVKKEIKLQLDLITDAISDLKNVLEDKNLIDLKDFGDDFGDDDDDFGEEEKLNENEKLVVQPLITLFQTCKGKKQNLIH